MIIRCRLKVEPCLKVAALSPTHHHLYGIVTISKTDYIYLYFRAKLIINLNRTPGKLSSLNLLRQFSAFSDRQVAFFCQKKPAESEAFFILLLVIRVTLRLGAVTSAPSLLLCAKRLSPPSWL